MVFAISAAQHYYREFRPSALRAMSTWHVMMQGSRISCGVCAVGVSMSNTLAGMDRLHRFLVKKTGTWKQYMRKKGTLSGRSMLQNEERGIKVRPPLTKESRASNHGTLLN